jgi:hypothetical protein
MHIISLLTSLVGLRPLRRQADGSIWEVEAEREGDRVVRDSWRRPGVLAGVSIFRYKTRHGTPLAKVIVTTVPTWWVLLSATRLSGLEFRAKKPPTLL